MKNHLALNGACLLERRLRKIKDGDKGEREAFVRDYMPFIVKSVSKCMGAYIETMDSDAFSVGLSAFDEAIDRYAVDKGKFISFAGLVIASRIKDHLRREKRQRAVPVSFLGEGDYRVDSACKQVDFTERFAEKEQMAKFKEILGTFGISVEQLIEASPKHRDTRDMALEAARRISRDSAVVKDLLNRKRLTYRRAGSVSGLSAKAFRRSNVFILATVLILVHDWPDLKGQIPTIRDGRRDEDGL